MLIFLSIETNVLIVIICFWTPINRRAIKSLLPACLFVFQVSILLYFLATKLKDLFQDIFRMTWNDLMKFEISGYFVVFIIADNILLGSVDLIKKPI